MKFPNLKWKSILASAQGLSQSEIARATEDAVKSAILAERKNVTSDDLLRRLNDRREMREAFRPSAVNK
jgi:histone H3/H4